MKVFIILLAAGESKRMNAHTKKQFLTIKGIPLFLWSVKTFLALPINQKPLLYLVYNHSDKQHFNSILKNYLNKSDIDKLNMVEGGNTRNESVFNGLKIIHSLANKNDFILVHDCARPFIRHNDILNIIHNLDSYPAVTLGHPITDTIKQVDQSNCYIKKHLNRDNLKGVLTPQGFHFSVIWEAYKKYIISPYPVTDDTQLVSVVNCLAKIINGNKDNIKITTQDDLPFANFYAEQYYSNK